MSNFSQLFLYIPGIIIFLIGSGQVRRWMRMHQSGSCMEGRVIGCQHVHKKDNRDRDVLNYYNITVEFTNLKTKLKERAAVKSPAEYSVNQSVKLFLDNGQYMIVDAEDEAIFNPWVTMIGGALLIILALEENRGKEIPAMVCLAIILLGAGIVLILHYISMKNRNLQELKGVIIGRFSRQISKETKIIKANKFTYYPIVKYTIDGKESIRHCNLNSSNEKSFAEGDEYILYYDPARKTVLEKRAQINHLVIGIVLAVIGALAGISIISVL